MCCFKNFMMMLNLNNFLWLKSNQTYFKKSNSFPAVTGKGDLYKTEKKKCYLLVQTHWFDSNTPHEKYWQKIVYDKSLSETLENYD